MSPEHLSTKQTILPEKIMIASASNFPKRSYLELGKKHNIKFDFFCCTRNEPIAVSQFRKLKPFLTKHPTAMIIPNKTAVDALFPLSKACNIQYSAEMKYFCLSPQIAHYLFKYIPARKRRVYPSESGLEGLFELIRKHKKEYFFLPCSEIGRPEISKFCKSNKYKYKESVIYKNVPADLADFEVNVKQMITFLRPMDVHCFHTKMHDKIGASTTFAVFGSATAQALKKKGWEATIKVPNSEDRSLLGALERYLKTHK